MAAGDLKNAPYGCVNDLAAGVTYTAPSGNGETNTPPAPAPAAPKQGQGGS
jgi:hypothetical protein